MVSNLYLKFGQFAQTVTNCEPGTDISQNPECQTTLPTVAADQATVNIILTYLFGVLGALSVAYIIFMALKLILAQGDSQEIAKARNGIIYASVGLAIAVSAELIIKFVLGSLGA